MSILQWLFGSKKKNECLSLCLVRNQKQKKLKKILVNLEKFLNSEPDFYFRKRWKKSPTVDFVNRSRYHQTRISQNVIQTTIKLRKTWRKRQKTKFRFLIFRRVSLLNCLILISKNLKISIFEPFKMFQRLMRNQRMKWKNIRRSQKVY